MKRTPMFVLVFTVCIFAAGPCHAGFWGDLGKVLKDTGKIIADRMNVVVDVLSGDKKAAAQDQATLQQDKSTRKADWNKMVGGSSTDSGGAKPQGGSDKIDGANTKPDSANVKVEGGNQPTASPPAPSANGPLGPASPTLGSSAPLPPNLLAMAPGSLEQPLPGAAAPEAPAAGMRGFIRTRDAIDMAARAAPTAPADAGAGRAEDQPGSSGFDPASRPAMLGKAGMGAQGRALTEAPRNAAETPAVDSPVPADVAAALSAAEQAAQSDPRNPVLLRRLALLYFKAGRYREALGALRTVLASKDATTEDLVRIAALLDALGDHAHALAALEQAAGLDSRCRGQLEEARRGGKIRWPESGEELGMDAPAPGRRGFPWALGLLGSAGMAGAVWALRRARRGAAPAAPGASTGVAGRFETVRVLARSEGEETVEARDKRLERLVAVRKLTCADPARRERAAKAARALAGVRHSALLEIYEIAEEEPGLCVVTEAWAGKTAAEMLASAGRLPAVQAVRLLDEACGALTAAHAQGVAHGRLGPSALLVTAEGSTKLVGFALEPPDAGGEDKRADVRALGACLCEITTGSPALPDARPSGLPAGLRMLIADASGPSPRIRTVEEFASRLGGYRTGS